MKNKLFIPKFKIILLFAVRRLLSGSCACWV